MISLGSRNHGVLILHTSDACTFYYGDDAAAKDKRKGPF